MRYSTRCLVILTLVCSFGSVRGETAADFSAPKLNGDRFRLSEALKNGPVLLHFWDTCCPGCREVLPDIEYLHGKFLNLLTVVAISTDTPKSQSKVKPLVKSKGYHFEVLLDDQMEVRKLFGGTESPLTILVAATGEIVIRRVGASAENRQALLDAVSSLLSVEPVDDGAK